jgi:hypothetical protein
MTTVASVPYHTSSYISAGKTNAAGAYTEKAATSDTKSDRSGASQPNGDGSTSSATINLQKKLFAMGGPVMSASETLKQINVSELPEDQYQIVMEQDQQALEASKRQLEDKYTDWSSTATVAGSLKAFPSTNSVATQTYATVVVGGKVVAAVDNQGVVGSDDELGAKLRDTLLGDVNGTNGPNLAQARAEQIAKLLGGKVVKSDTAITQGTFSSLPSSDSRPRVDYDAMKSDALYQQIQDMSDRLTQTQNSRAAYLASQQTGSLNNL